MQDLYHQQFQALWLTRSDCRERIRDLQSGVLRCSCILPVLKIKETLCNPELPNAKIQPCVAPQALRHPKRGRSSSEGAAPVIYDAFNF